MKMIFMLLCIGMCACSGSSEKNAGRGNGYSAPYPKPGTAGNEFHANGAPKAYVYRGPGACDDGCWEAAFNVATAAGFDSVYVGPQDQVSFDGISLWMQPGGKSSTAVNAMSAELKNSLIQFVKNGGAYVGFCAGAFSSTEWVGTTNYRGFGILPGRTILYPSNHQADILDVQWNGKLRHLYWEGGPYITEIPEGEAEAVAFYPNGEIAAARSLYGKGKVFVTGLHPEAPQDWRDYYQLQDADGVDTDLAVDMVRWATGK